MLVLAWRRSLSQVATATATAGRSFNALLEEYVAETPLRISVRDLVRTGQRTDLQVLIENAQLVQKELPVRMAHRVKDMQHLPFIVGCNPYVKRVYELYVNSFKQLVSIPQVQTLEDELEFTKTLSRLVDEHTDVIPKLSRGMLESKMYISVGDMHNFLDRKIRARIGIRVLAEQHLALHVDLREKPRPGYVGIIHQYLRPADVVYRIGTNAQNLCEVNYGSKPELIINGHVDATFAFIPVHLEYIIFELLKNAFRATAERASKKNNPVAPVEVTISKGPSDISIRIRDRGGGVSLEHLKDIWTYAYTTVSSDEGEGGLFAETTKHSMQTGVGGPMAGLGYGLPMSKVYAEYFGGNLDLVSLYGYGCDVFLRLVHLQDQMQSVEI